MAEEPQILKAKKSSKGFLIKDKDSGQKLKIRGYGDKKKHGLLLRDYEVLFLIHSSKFEVFQTNKKLTFNDILNIALLRDQTAWTKFLIYRDLRTRGYIPKEGFGFGTDFRVYEKGEYGSKPAKYVIFAMNEGTELNVQSLTSSVKQILRMGKLPIVAVVERRGEVIYYHLSKSRFRDLH